MRSPLPRLPSVLTVALLGWLSVATVQGHGHGHTTGRQRTTDQLILDDAPPPCPLKQDCPLYGKILQGHQGEGDSAPADSDEKWSDPKRCPYYGKKTVWPDSAAPLPPGHPDPAGKDPTQCPYTRLKQQLGLAGEDGDTAGAGWFARLLGTFFPGSGTAPGAAASPPLWSYFFSSDPMISSFLATAYISIFPNLVLLFVPPDIAPRSLNILVSFAVGGLLGDVFLHLLPHAFTEIVQEPANEHPQQITVVGLAIFFGLMVFFAIDKVMRISGAGHDHGHAHGIEAKSTAIPASENPDTDAVTSARSEPADGLRRRVPSTEKDSTPATSPAAIATGTASASASPPVKFSAYLNIIADATHNFTDGLAMAASFYSSPAIGISTTIAVFFHEIPHEIGDYAILVQSGLSRRQAMLAQCVTALGAFAGTLAGVLIQELGSKPGAGHHAHGHHESRGAWLLAGLEWGDLVIPFTAGGFIYIATVGVIPDLLQVPEDKTDPTKPASAQRGPFRQAMLEFSSMLLGILLMVLVNSSD
ncbi:hypothetical protein H4R33_002029 [Dimargaris cristalligena]|nr:hypothetical protein H4R33_002029 [Dimargaris cristalligena]